MKGALQLRIVAQVNPELHEAHLFVQNRLKLCAIESRERHESRRIELPNGASHFPGETRQVELEARGEGTDDTGQETTCPRSCRARANSS